MAPRWGQALGWLAFLGWLVWRCNSDGQGLLRVGLPASGLTYLYLDASWLALVVAVALWSRWPPPARHVWIAGGALALMVSAQFFAAAATRYYAGHARAWDLANYVQPMWRAAHGLPMTSRVYDDRPVWADHGSFAMFAFAPWTRVTSDAATGLFAVQSLLAGGSALVLLGLALTLGLPPYVALACAAVVASSRALAHAARFDFHPECAFGVLLYGLAWAKARARLVSALVLGFCALCLRDMAALTVGMLWLYWAWTERSRAALLASLASFGLAALDLVWLPRWTGWPSYVALHGSTGLDLELAVASTAMRMLSTFAIGWLHPLAWSSGAPWILAAALSPKSGVKGIDFQYGFLFVPVAALGAVCALAALARRRPRWLPIASGLWVALGLAVNAPLASTLSTTFDARQGFLRLKQRLDRLVPGDASVVADACAAPYLMERRDLTLLCRLDAERLQTRGEERWEEPVPQALEASQLVVRQDCRANGPCAAEQVRRAQQQHGFELQAREGSFVVLRRRAAGDEPR